MRARCLSWVIGFLCLLAGCNSAPKVSEDGEEKQASGALLRTGAFQLGPGVSRDLLRSQGDGQGGFPIE